MDRNLSTLWIFGESALYQVSSLTLFLTFLAVREREVESLRTIRFICIEMATFCVRALCS